ncbi:MAG: metallophosphoesterase [Archangiaceae bacterium]|nr:metallophosphoesterase [Archangiaceae bacterium]
MQSLVHLSDLHLGSPRSLSAARALVGQLSTLGNAVVVVTGDVTWGHLSQWRAYREIFAPLGERLITLPGNHDRCHDDVARFITDRRVWTIERPGLSLVCVDTTAPHNRKPYRSHGALCEAVLGDVVAALQRVPADALRVVAMHHHLVPLPVEGVGEWFAEAFGWPHASELGLGTQLLRSILGECDLVLHGHRHVPREFVADAPNGRALRVLNAGATLELGACRVFDLARGAYAQRWLQLTPTRRPLTVPARELALST